MTQSLGRRKGASRADVAQRAGVSPTTVSIALNGKGPTVGLAAATVDRIRAAAAELHYTPNATARALRTQQRSTIGLIMPRPIDGPHAPVFADIVLSTIDAARESGHFILLMTDAETDDLDQQLRSIDIGGLVAQYGQHTPLIESIAEQRGIPVAWVDPGESSSDTPGRCLVRPRHEPGMRELVDHLENTGTSSLMILDGPRSGYPDGQRYAPLLRRFGRRLDRITASSWTSEAGRAAMREHLASDDPPASIFAANDYLAAGALQACREAAIRVGEDIRIAGFGNFAIADQLDPALTTVEWPLAEVARRAVRMVAGELDGSGALPSQTVEIDTTFILRQSA